MAYQCHCNSDSENSITVNLDLYLFIVEGEKIKTDLRRTKKGRKLLSSPLVFILFQKYT